MIRPLLYIGYTKEADGGDRHSIDVAQSSIRQVNVGSINSYQDTAIWVKWKRKIPVSITKITAKDLLDELGFKYVVANNTIFRQRMEIVKKAEAVVKKSITNKQFAKVIKGLKLFLRGSSLEDNYSNNVDQFCSGTENEIDMIEYDLWDMSSSARTEHERLWDELNKYVEYLNSLCNGQKFYFEFDDGDWDGGYIVMRIK